MAKFNATGVYAFVAWIASMVVFVVFLIWAFSPRSFFHEMGITYYPSRYYALALPAYMIMLVLVVVMSYIGINMMMTLEADDMRTIRDSQSRSSPNVFIKCSTIGGKIHVMQFLHKNIVTWNALHLNTIRGTLLQYLITIRRLHDTTTEGIPDIGDLDPVDVSYLIFNQNEKKMASTAKIRKALSWRFIVLVIFAFDRESIYWAPQYFKGVLS